MRINTRYRTALAVWAICLIVLLNPCLPRVYGGTIKPITAEELDRMLTRKPSRSMVVFMAAWCKPCREEIPTVEKLHRQYRQSGISVFGLSVDPGGPQALQAVLDRNGATFPVYWAGNAVMKTYGIYGIPITFLIKNGEIIARIPGQRTETYLKKKIDQLLIEE